MEKNEVKKYWFKKFIYAFNGIFSSVKEEKSMIVHLIISAITIILAGSLKITDPISWAILIIMIGVVLGTELLNTSLENLVDLVSFEYNINARKIKDTGAASTLIVSIVAIIVALLIFVPRIMEIANGSY